MTSEEQLRARLRKIEALFAGATTPGERGLRALTSRRARHGLGSHGAPQRQQLEHLVLRQTGERFIVASLTSRRSVNTEDPADLSKTTRVLTIMLTEDWRGGLPAVPAPHFDPGDVALLAEARVPSIVSNVWLRSTWATASASNDPAISTASAQTFKAT